MESVSQSVSGFDMVTYVMKSQFICHCLFSTSIRTKNVKCGNLWVKDNGK